MMHRWQNNQKMHTIMGYASFVLTMAATFLVISYMAWSIQFKLHYILGLIFALLSVGITLSGSFALYLMQYGKVDINEVELRH